MARKRASAERQIAETIVDSLLKTNKQRGKKQSGIYALITLLVVVFGLIWTSSSPFEENERGESVSVSNSDEAVIEPSSEDRFSVPERERVQVERCVDGDTLIVITSSGKRERVRLIGANAPETVKTNWPIEPFGPEASAYTKSRVEEAGYVVTLVADGSRYDRYNRRLSFVYLGDDPISLNEDLCRQGLAKAETKYSFSKEMKDRLTAAAAAAEREGLGIYSLAE
jgi:micrococcal nuclease